MKIIDKPCNIFTPDKIRVHLKRRAMAGKPTTYGNLVEDISGVRCKGHLFRRYLRRPFAQIDREDRRCGQPYLTSMVVREDTWSPGRGFYVGKCDMTTMTEADLERFSEEMQDRVIEYYAGKDRDPPSE